MGKKYDLCIIGWTPMRAKFQCELWGLGIYPHPYHRDSINAFIINNEDYIRSIDLDLPVVIINLPDGTIPVTVDVPISPEYPTGKAPNPAFNAARCVKERGNNCFEFNGDVTMTLKDILKKRVKLIENGKRVWVLENVHE